MEYGTLSFVLLYVGSLFIGFGIGKLFKDIDGKFIATLVFIGLISILFSRGMAIEINKGKPASLSVLTVDEKYEVVAVYDGRYIITKSVTDKKQLRFIGPLDFVPPIVKGVHIKTKQGTLENLSLHLH